MTAFGVSQLIEKSENFDLLKSIVEGVSEWLNDTVLSNKERTFLMIKLFQNLNKRIFDLSNEKQFDKEKLETLQVKFLDIVYQVYLTERSRTTDLERGTSELISKLEPSYLWGLTHPKTRRKFFSLYDDWVPRTMHERLVFYL